MSKKKKVCGNCGSDNIVFDAYARWNEDKQEFEVSNVFDWCMCEDCETEEHVIDQEIP